MQCHNQPSGRRQGIQSFRLGSKSEPCGLTAWTGFGLLAFIIQLIQTLIQTLSPAVGGSWKTPIQKSLFFSKLCWEFQSAQHAKPLCLKLGSDVAFCCALTWLLWAFCLVGFYSVLGVEAQFQKATCKTATCPPSAGGTAKGMKPRAPTKPKRKLIHLEVPPVNTEPERRHLSYDEMEEIGKLRRERRRWEKVLCMWQENKHTCTPWRT